MKLFWPEFQLNQSSTQALSKNISDASAGTHTNSDGHSKFLDFQIHGNSSLWRSRFFRQVASYLQLLQCPCYIGHFCRIKWIKCSQCHLLQDVPKTICDWPINKIKWKKNMYGYEVQRGILLLKKHDRKINISIHQPYNKLKSVQPSLNSK